MTKDDVIRKAMQAVEMDDDSEAMDDFIADDVDLDDDLDFDALERDIDALDDGF